MNVSLTLADLESHDPHSRTGRSQRRFLCPLCGADKPRDAAHRSLSLNTGTGRWVCHRCGARGLLNHFNAGLPNEVAPIIVPVRQSPKTGIRFDWHDAWRRSAPLPGSPGAVYLRQRSIPASFAQLAGVRYSPLWYGRPAVLFPIRDQKGRLVAVNGRFTREQNALRTMTGGTRSLGLFVTPSALAAQVVAITEGPMDALSLACCHLPALALMGTSWPDWLPEAVAGSLVLIATDADAAGESAAARLAEVFSGIALHSARLRPPIGRDWNDVLQRTGRRQMQKLISHCPVAASLSFTSLSACI